MTMVEKVARAIYRTEGAVYTDEDRMFEPYPYDELDEIERSGYECKARAAIEAMREPDEEMIEAGVTADTGKTLGERVTNCFVDMIDAALKERQ